MREEVLTEPMRILATLLERRTGQVLSENRLWRLETSLRPILRANGLRTLDELVACIGSDTRGMLATQTVNALLNNETSFYRDAHIFHMLSSELLPDFFERRTAEGGRKLLRIWSAGCSTGQEAYSLAMMLLNNRSLWPGWRVEILATDVSNTAIERAKSGLVPQIEVQRGLPINDLLRWMEPAGEQWQVSQTIRNMIEFRVENLCDGNLQPGEFDIVLCRNVLLYFTGARRNQIFSVLSDRCAVGGHLLLGAGETIIGQTRDFATSSRFRGAYQRIDPANAGAGI